MLDPASPDVDVTVSPASQVVAAGTQYTFDYTITNNGESGSVADGLRLTSTLGTGWTAGTVEVVTPGAGGSTGTCAGGICTASDLGVLAAGQSAVVRVTATASDAGALTMAAQLEGSLSAFDGSDTGNNYSLDQAQVQVIGCEASLLLTGTSEAETSGADVAIGEEQTWRLNVKLFGSTPFSNVIFRNTMTSGLGYVSHAATVNNTLTISGVTLNGSNVTAATPVQSGTLDFAIANTSGGEFEVDLVTRALNIASNTQSQPLFSLLDASLLADFGSGTTVTFAPNSPVGGFGGSEAALHSDGEATVAVPDPRFETVVRNVTTGSSFVETVPGQAGDVIEYRTTLRNVGQAPLFDVTISDTPASTKLLVVGGATDGVDNDGDGLTDSSDSGGEGAYVTGSGGNATFDEANTQLTAGSSLGRLNPGTTITLLYRATLDSGVVPSELLLDNSSLTASTLAGANGGQTAMPGAAGSATGERTFTDTNSATVAITMITLTKSVDATSVSASTGNDVFIGEQVRFELAGAATGWPGAIPPRRRRVASRHEPARYPIGNLRERDQQHHATDDRTDHATSERQSAGDRVGLRHAHRLGSASGGSHGHDHLPGAGGQRRYQHRHRQLADGARQLRVLLVHRQSRELVGRDADGAGG